MANRPKPTRLKVLQGNPGKRPLNQREPKPRAKSPSPPKYLDAYAKTEWRRITKHLDPVGLLSELDRAVLASYCQAVSEQRHAIRKMAADGRYATNARGELVRAPWVLTFEKATDAIRKHAIEFGLTPAARSRIEVGIADVSNPGGSPHDPLAEARRRRRESRAS